MSYLSFQTRDSRGRFVKNLPPTLKLMTTPPVEFNRNYDTNQIYSKGFEFAFMSDVEGTYKQACTFVYCKDFLHDAMWAAVNRTKWSIFQFHYDTAKDILLDMNHCVLAFRNTLYKTQTAEFHQAREACQEFLNELEEKMGFEPSQVYEVPHADSPCWLVIGDKGWQHAPPMVGLFTLVIRVGFMHQLGDSADETLEKAKEGKIKIGDNSDYAGHRDCSYIASAWKGIQVILKYGLDIFYENMSENYPKDLRQRGANLHNDFGPVNFTKVHDKANRGAHKAMPHWYRKKYWT